MINSKSVSASVSTIDTTISDDGGSIDPYIKSSGSLEQKEIKLTQFPPTIPAAVGHGHGNDKKGWKRYAGLVFAVLSSVAYTTCGLLTKILTNRGYNPLTTTFWRYQGLTIFTPFLIFYYWRVKHQNVFNTLWKDGQTTWTTLFYLFLRSTIGYISLGFYVFSLQYLKLGDAIVIANSTPIAVIIFARVFLKESCGIIPIVIAIGTFIGVVVLTRPPLLTGEDSFDENVLIGSSLAFCSMILIASLYVILRFIRKEHYTVTMLSFSYVASVEGLIAILILDVFEFPRNLEDWWITLLNAIMGLIGQVTLVFSLKYEEAGPVAIIRTLDILLAFVFQLIILQVFPDILSIVGATIITIGIICSALRKIVATLPPKHPAKVKYGFLLK